MTDPRTVAAIEIAKDIAEVIRLKKQIPSGHLYASLMGVMNLDTYNSLIAIVVSTGLVRLEPSNLLVWIGGDKKEGA